MDTATANPPAYEDLGKATGWANPPGVGDLQADIDATRPSQQEFVTCLRQWMDYLETRGEGAPPKRKGRSQIQPKLIKKHAEWRHPSMSEPFLSSSKLFTVKPRTWEDAKSAVEAELLLNYQFERYIDKVKFVDEYVRVGDNQGTVVIEVGWNRVVEMVPTEVPTVSFFQITDPMDMEQLKNDIGLMRNPLEFNKLPVERKEAAELSLQQQVALIGVVTKIEVRDIEKVIKNHPTLTIVDNMNLFIDPSCNGDIKQARFIAYSFETSKGELRKDKRYKNIDMINPSATANANEAQHNTYTPNTFQFKDEERKRFIAFKMYCLWDVEGDGVLKPILAVWAMGICLLMTDSPFSDGEFPFIVVPVNPIVKQWHGEPDGALLIENQKTVGALTRGMVDLLGRSANGQQGMPKQFLDAPNRRKFDNGEDYEYNPQMGNPEQLIVMHKYPEIPQSALILMQSQASEAESQTGVNTFGGGVNAGSLGDVAAGIKGALAASAKREMSILRRYANGVAAIGRKFLSMSKDFLTDEEIIRVTNEQFVSITREGIDGQHDISVEVASAEEDNLKAQELSFMLQTIGPSVDWGITRKVMAEIARLRKMPLLSKEISEYEPQPDPMAAAESEAKIRKLNAEAAAAEAQSLADQARAQYYIAQARKLGSEADLNDLDFVEQESGTKHVRKMAELEAQSEANQDLAVTKVLAENGQVPAAIGFNQLTRSRA